MSESTETDNAIKFLKSLPFCYPFKIVPGPYGRRGRSDIFVVYYGLFIAIEMKVGSNKPTDQQFLFMRNVQRKGGGLAFPCWSCAEVRELMKCVKEKIEKSGLGATLNVFQGDVIETLRVAPLKGAKKGMIDMRK